MKSIASRFTLLAVILFVVSAPIAQSQVVPASQKTFEGRLTRVDPAMKTITITGMEDKEVKIMSFKYSDDTVVVGGDKTVQGLSGNTGTSLKITYRADRGSNEATRIEVTGK